MRILFVSDTYYPHINGVYYFVCRIAPLLQEAGHTVAVIAPSGSFGYSEKIIDGIHVYGVPSLPVIYYPGFRVPSPLLLRRRLHSIQQRFSPDIVHVQDHFIIARTMIELSKKAGIPVMGTNHFMPENITALVRSEKWKRRIEKYCWSKFQKVFNQLALVTTPTWTAAELIRPKLDVLVKVVSSGLDVAQFSAIGNEELVRKKYGIPGKPVLLYVGRLDPEKNINDIINAFAIAAKSIDACCVIAGKGIARASLERLSAHLGLEGKVIFTGFVEEKDLPALYQLSHCFAIASTAELLSLATLQAMACALPVIAVNAGALPELVKEDVNGYLFEKGDTITMSVAICQVFGDNNLRTRMGRKSHEMSTGHDIRRSVRVFESLYEHCTRIRQLYRDSYPVVHSRYKSKLNQ